MRSGESFFIKNQPAGTYPFTLKNGGIYAITVSGTTPTVQLNRLAGDGTTFVPQGAAITTASVTAPFYLGPGQYNLVLTVGSAFYVDVTRVPGE
jgi:hypothetical protein